MDIANSVNGVPIRLSYEQAFKATSPHRGEFRVRSCSGADRIPR